MEHLNKDFISQTLWDLVEGDYKEPSNEEAFVVWSQAKQRGYEENQKKDAWDLLLIQHEVSKTIFSKIMGANKPKDA